MPAVQRAAPATIQLPKQAEMEIDMADFMSCSFGSDGEVDFDLLRGLCNIAVLHLHVVSS